MIITHKYKVLDGSSCFYAVGDQILVIRAAESTFSTLGWTAKRDKHGFLVHYTGGVLERAASAYGQACNMHWQVYEPDTIRVEIHTTNNPMVSLVRTRIHLKYSWMTKKKQQDRATRFQEAFLYEFAKLELPLVSTDKWNGLVETHPILRCSPVWNPQYWQPVPVATNA